MTEEKRANRQLSRREFLKASALTATGIAAASCAPAATPTAELAGPAAAVAGATPEERALNGIKALKEAGLVKDGDTFTIMHHSGQRNNIVPALEQWNQLTGLNFQSAEIGLESDIYTKAMNEAVVRTGDYDIFVTFANWIGDMAEAGLIVDQTDWWAKYDPEVDHGPNRYVPPLDKFTSLYKGRRYSMGADDDTFSLFFRKDIYGNPDEAAAFEDQVGRKLELPKTWPEFDEWIAFFDRPDEGIRGAHMYAERYFAYTAWAARFISKGGAYFNADMDPLIASEEGVTALEEQIRLVQNYMWPDAVTGDWSHAYSHFPAGEVFFAWAWPSLGKFAEDPANSKIIGKVGAMPMPGTMHNGNLVVATPHVVGWSCSVSKYGKAPEAAYCWIQWFNGPTVGLESIARVGTLDAFREPWFEAAEMKTAYGEAFLPILHELTKTAFADIALRGAAEYLDNLNLNLQQAFAGQKDAQASLQDTASAWQETTDRIGRLGQMEAWRGERQNYPQAIQDLWASKGTF